MSRVWAADPTPQARPPELALISEALHDQTRRFLALLAALLAVAAVSAVVAGLWPAGGRHDLQTPTDVLAVNAPAAVLQ